MPFVGDHANDIGLETADGPVCKFDVAEGKMKSPEEIFEGGVQYFTKSVADGDRDLAERITRKNMKSLSYWQAHPFEMLNGEEATDEEFGTAMTKLQA
jgi:hypothetical protein